MSDALHLTDRVLVDRLLAGDPEAADLFVTRFSRLVWAVLVRDFRLSDDEFDDIYQEVFLRLMQDEYRRIRLWHGEGDFAAFLCPIVRNRALDFVRRKHPEREHALDDHENEDITAQGPDQELLAWIDEQRRAVERALESLPREDRELYRLRCEEELAYRKIAGQLGITVNLVGVRLARLVDKLRRAVETLQKTRKTGAGVRLTGPEASTD